jgi:cytochrome c-type biogenesis protein CcmH/NrfG
MQAYRRALGLARDSVEAWRGLARAAAIEGDAAAAEEAREALAAVEPEMAARLASPQGSSPPGA